MAVAKIVSGSTSNACFTLSPHRLPLFQLLLSMVLVVREPLLLVSLITALVKMDNRLTTVKENNRCFMALTDNHLALLVHMVNLSTVILRRHPRAIILHSRILTRRLRTLLRRVHPMTHKGRDHLPSMMNVSVSSVPLLMMTPTTRILMRPSLLIPTLVLAMVHMTRVPIVVAVMITQTRPAERQPRLLPPR